MAMTKIPAALVPKIWAAKCWTEVKKELFFSPFTGANENNIVQLDDNLKKNKGDQVTFGLLMDLKGDGVGEGEILEGNEEKLTYYDMAVNIHQRRFGVRLGGEFEEQKSAYDMYSQAKDKLKIRMQTYCDKLIFDRLTANPSPYRVLYAAKNGTYAKAEKELTVDHKMDTYLLEKAKRIAKLKPTDDIPRIQPLQVKGKATYIIVMHEYQFRDLKQDERWWNAQLHAANRGNDNPIFSGAEGWWDGMPIYTHENIGLTTTGASGANVGHALLLGAQAAVWAVSKNMYMREKEFDYGDQKGMAMGIIHEVAKSVFNGIDFGVMQIMTGAAGE